MREDAQRAVRGEQQALRERLRVPAQVRPLAGQVPCARTRGCARARACVSQEGRRVSAGAWTGLLVVRVGRQDLVLVQRGLRRVARRAPRPRGLHVPTRQWRARWGASTSVLTASASAQLEWKCAHARRGASCRTALTMRLTASGMPERRDA